MQSAVFHSHIPVGEMTCQAKLRRDSVFASLTALLTQVFLTSSSLFFNPYHKIQLASGDYEGCVCLWDVNKTIKIVNNQEHSKRVWSVVYNPAEPSMYASGSDDCTGKVLSHCPSLSSHSPSLPPQWNSDALLVLTVSSQLMQIRMSVLYVLNVTTLLMARLVRLLQPLFFFFFTSLSVSVC